MSLCLFSPSHLIFSVQFKESRMLQLFPFVHIFNSKRYSGVFYSIKPGHIHKPCQTLHNIDHLILIRKCLHRLLFFYKTVYFKGIYHKKYTESRAKISKSTEIHICVPVIKCSCWLELNSFFK